jgi:hypothetical protein
MAAPGRAPASIPVLVVGARPAGLARIIELAPWGVAYVLVDGGDRSERRVGRRSRAYLHLKRIAISYVEPC